ncbi:MAG TPA: S41 family peptidase, partial [Candidatus Eisenbacteria bacterium]
ESMILSLGGHLVSEPTPFATFTIGDPSNPGSFSWAPTTVSIKPIAPRFDGKIAILVDEVSQSHAEYTAMAFRAVPGAIVVGSTTAGADGNVSRIPLPGGLRTMMSGIGVFYPDRRPTQRVGIVPDITVRPTVAGIRDGRDEVLDAAVSRVLGRGLSDAESSVLETPGSVPASGR